MLTLLKNHFRQFAAVIVFTLALAVITLPVPLGKNEAVALPNCASTTEYYSDGTYTTQVGFKSILCNGQVIRGGTVTSFKIVYLDGACSAQYAEACGG